MFKPLMPKATAVWLIDNTALSFEQIADFCGLHAVEIQAMADGEVSPGIKGLDPIANGQLTKEEVERCEKDEDARLEMNQGEVFKEIIKKSAKYTPVSKRQDKPGAILWLIKNHPELSVPQICKLIGTTKPTVVSVRDKTHWNMAALKPKNPIVLGFCTEADLEKMLKAATKGAKQP